MGIFNLRPARPVVPENTRVVVDLDRLAAEPVGFKWRGKVHLIKPMTTQQYLSTCNEWAYLESVAKKKDANEEDIVEAYVRLFSTVCSTLGRQDVYDMSLPQRGALMQQIFEIVSGKAFSEKKSPEKEVNQT